MSNRLERSQRIESAEHSTVLDPQDIAARFEELRTLKDGWLDGKGRAPHEQGLAWLAGMIENAYPDQLPLPYVYPVADGGVQLEWSIKNQEASLEIDLFRKTGDWHVLDLSTNMEESQELDFNDGQGWMFVISRLMQMSGAPAK